MDSEHSRVESRSSRWKRRPLTVQAVTILALAIGPLLISIVLLGVTSERDHAIDEELYGHRTARSLQTELLKDMVDAETGVRGFLLTQDRSFLEPYRRAMAELPVVLRRLQNHERTEGDSTFREAKDLAERELRILTRLVASPESQDSLLFEGEEVMGEFRERMTEVMAAQDLEISQHLAERESHTGSTRSILLAGGIASLIGAIIGGTLLMLGIVRRLRIVTENARRVAEGDELEPVRGNDEIAELAHQLERSAQLLRARESELRQAKEEADRANHAKSDFISRMSHELRTPLNAILGFAQMLREDADETASADISQILRAGRHLLSLINEVLELSRIEAGKFSISPEQVAIDEVVGECVELMAPLASPRQVTISNDVQNGSYVVADRQRLKQVLLNLLSNAVKYNKSGGRVDISCSAGDGLLRLYVRDTGPGIPEVYLDRLFVPFARLGAEATEVEGSGLGLALSLRLMQMMGGDMDIGTTSSDGSEFWLELKTAEPQVLVRQAEIADVPAATGSTHGADVTILQVEDNPMNIRLLERIFSRRPHVRLVTVQQGGEAVDMARSAKPALILLDVNLPDISGREVLARLRAEPSTRDIPVVMLSADASPNQIERLLASGAVAYLTKPLDVSHFLSVVDEVLERGEVA